VPAAAPESWILHLAFVVSAAESVVDDVGLEDFASDLLLDLLCRI
jgi:hypothetical protein